MTLIVFDITLDFNMEQHHSMQDNTTVILVTHRNLFGPHPN